MRKTNILRTRITRLMERTSDEERKARLRIALYSLNRTERVNLTEQRFKPYRALTLQEKRAPIEFLNEEFNSISTDLEDEMTEATNLELERVAKSAKKSLDAGDIAAIAAITFYFRGAMLDAIKRNITRSFDAGKRSASKELKTGQMPTSLLARQIMNADAMNVADGYASDIERTAVSALINAVAVGAGSAEAVSAMMDTVESEAARAITNIGGSLPGQYVNRGRKAILGANLNRITSFQRSEVLDDRTCDMCLSLDKRVVKADDPMAQMEIVHTHCRGFWVPIFAVDEEQPDITGIPKTIASHFETIDGRPVINSFTQLKKPIVLPANKEIAKKIQGKLKG